MKTGHHLLVEGFDVRISVKSDETFGIRLDQFRKARLRSLEETGRFRIHRNRPSKCSTLIGTWLGTRPALLLPQTWKRPWDWGG